jgi:hypothetical protein
LHYVLQLQVYREPMGYVTSVLQPVMVFYSLAVILLAFWLACRWACRKKRDGHPRGYHIWHMLSDASFGVYLIHALLLTAILKWVVPAMPTVWPVAIRVFLTWFITVGSATGISVMLLNIPVLSRLVGREHPARRKTVQLARQDRPVEQPRQTELGVRHLFALLSQSSPGRDRIHRVRLRDLPKAGGYRHADAMNTVPTKDSSSLQKDDAHPTEIICRPGQAEQALSSAFLSKRGTM